MDRRSREDGAGGVRRALFEQHLVAVAAHCDDEARLLAVLRLDAAAHAADHAVNIGVVDIAAGFGPDGLGDLILADDAAATLVEKPEQIELLGAKRRIEEDAVDINLAGGDVNAQGRFTYGDERRRRDSSRRIVKAERGGGEAHFSAVVEPGRTARRKPRAVDGDAGDSSGCAASDIIMNQPLAKTDRDGITRSIAVRFVADPYSCYSMAMRHGAPLRAHDAIILA